MSASESKKMNPEVKAKWIAALESGEYAQCKGKLKDDDGGFCCLGVLTDVYIKEDPANRQWVFEDLGGDSSFFTFNNNGGLLDMEVAQWAGLVSKDPEVPINYNIRSHSTLSGINDRGASFTEIANIIKEHL